MDRNNTASQKKVSQKLEKNNFSKINQLKKKRIDTFELSIKICSDKTLYTSIYKNIQNNCKNNMVVYHLYKIHHKDMNFRYKSTREYKNQTVSFLNILEYIFHYFPSFIKDSYKIKNFGTNQELQAAKIHRPKMQSSKNQRNIKKMSRRI